MLGTFYQNLEQLNQIEDIVSTEVALSIKYQSYPGCTEIIQTQNQYKTYEMNDDLIIWKYQSESQILQKVIMDKHSNVVFEEFKINNIGTSKCEMIAIVN